MNSTTLLTPGRTPELLDDAATFRQPSYDCQEHRVAMKITVFIPGVDASGVDIEGSGADLTVTARKSHFVRVNFNALHLEHVQRDYRLRLRLGHGYDYSQMAAEITRGVLTITLPKRARGESHIHLRKVA